MSMIFCTMDKILVSEPYLYIVCVNSDFSNKKPKANKKAKQCIFLTIRKMQVLANTELFTLNWFPVSEGKNVQAHWQCAPRDCGKWILSWV
jgi:hypothetical protein